MHITISNLNNFKYTYNTTPTHQPPLSLLYMVNSLLKDTADTSAEIYF